MTEAYAKAFLAVASTRMREVIDEVAKTETNPIKLHRLAEVAAECEWVNEQYGETAK